MNKPLIAFMDLLGSGYLAIHSPVRYMENVDTFQHALTSGAQLLADDDRVFCFSDCAYLQSSSSERMAHYLRHVRHELLRQGVYIKAAVGYGELQATDVHRKGQIRNPAIRERRQRLVSGTAFGPDVVKVY